MENFYNSYYKSLHAETNIAYDNIMGNNASWLGEDISQIKAYVDVMMVANWGDSAKSTFEEVQREVSSSLSKLISGVDVFAQGQEVYKNLKTQLDEFQKGDELYTIHINNEPQIEYETIEKNGNSWKQPTLSSTTAHDTWLSIKNELFNKCNEMKNNVDEYVEILEEINGLEVGEKPTKLITCPAIVNCDEFDMQIFDGYEDFSTFTVSGIELEYLKGYDLFSFKNENGIPTTGKKIMVGKTTKNVNGVEFEVYYVFDLEDGKNNDGFITYTQDTLNQLANVDAPVLQRIRNSGSAIIFEQTYNCDGGSSNLGYWNGGAYCNSLNRNIVVFNHSDDTLSYDYYTNSIIHEAGHAYDFALAYDSTGETGIGISAIDSYNFRDLIETEASNSLSEIDEFSLYSLENFRGSPTEYFAECFNAYYSNKRGNLAFVSYGSYSFIDNLVRQEL